MKKNLKYMMMFLLMILAGCDSWLNVKPEEERSSADYWTTKDDVRNTTIAGYVSLRECLDKIIHWGELRGNGLEFVSTNVDDQDLRDIASLDINSVNEMVKWGEFYKVINTANSVLNKAESVLSKDNTFEREEYESYMSENIFIRSLCYFYLVRSFGEVPFILEPFLTDDQGFVHAKVPERTIIDQLIKDLEAALQGSTWDAIAIDPAYKWQTKARATHWAIRALLADIYLWDGQYGKAEETCAILVKSRRFSLGEKEDWFSNYNPGDSEEIIFQIYFDHGLKQSNNMFTMFYGANKDYLIPKAFAGIDEAAESFEGTGAFEEGDIRGEGGTFNDNREIWKYIGLEHKGKTRRSKSNLSPNWICYRYADVLLMQAEALVMSGDTVPNYKDAILLVNEVRERAGATLLAEDTVLNEVEFLNTILDERRKEFVAEGKSWYDLLRIGKRDNYKHIDLMKEKILDNVSSLERPVYASKLYDLNSYFFPIPYTEIEYGGGVLVQNPYYQ